MQKLLLVFVFLEAKCLTDVCQKHEVLDLHSNVVHCVNSESISDQCTFPSQDTEQ